MPAGALRRPRLEEQLDESFGKRLTVVVAGAGFGKSTLLASWCSDVAAAWCGLSERDAGLARVARALGGALGPWIPRVSSLAAVAAGSAEAPSGVRDQADALAGALSDALERTLTHDLLLVLDDAHELPAGSPAERLVESLCKHAPPLLHVVVSSRAGLTFPIERLRGRGEVLELSAADLSFTVEEISSLAAQLELPLPAQAAESLHEATGGWPAAVRLVLEAVRRLPGRRLDEILASLSGPRGPLYGYLAEEVFGREEPELRELLRRSAPFERFSAGLCAALGCTPEALSELIRRGVVAEHDGWLATHHLVRDFVAHAWPLGAEEAVEIHLRAAEWLEAEGHDEDALHSLAAAGDGSGIDRVLALRGSQLLARGGAEAVVRFGERVEPGRLAAPSEEVLAEAYTVLGDTDRALEHLARAARGADELGASLAWRLVVAHHLRDDLEAASAVRARTRLDGAPAFDRALLLAWSASVERRRGEFEEAERLAAEALAAAEESGDDRARALAFTASALAREGSGQDPLPDLERALALAGRAGDVFQVARIHNNRGSILLESGSYREAIDELNEGLQLAELGGFTTLSALATMNRGLSHFCLGRLDEASADYEAAATVYRRVGSREVAYALIGLGDVHRERGDGAQARALYEQGLALGEETGDRQALVPGLYQLAKVLVDEEPERARELAERAVGYGWPDLAWALNARGWVALALGDPTGAAEDARRAAEAARDARDPYGLAESLELAGVSSGADGTAPLEEALAIWRRLGNAVHEAEVELALARLSAGSEAHRAGRRAEARLGTLGVRASSSGPAGLLREIALPRDVPLAVETLGGFRVLRSGTLVPADAWQSQKARDLLKILVARRGAPTPRELLMEALWPGDDPAKLGNRLSVALSTVRAVLDPEREEEPERFLWADRRAVGLDFEHVVVDVEEFLAEATEGLELRAAGRGESLERLRHALTLYRGDFLEGDVYEDWAAPLREEARAVYLDVAHALAGEAVASAQHDLAIRYCLRILSRDRYDERAHLSLVASLAAAGRHGEARRRYGVYRRLMSEIGVEASPFPA